MIVYMYIFINADMDGTISDRPFHKWRRLHGNEARVLVVGC